MSRIARELMRGGHKHIQFAHLASVVSAGVRDAKILCVGDSATAGIGASGQNQGDPNSYPYQMATVLNGLSVGYPVARGLGIPGHGTNPDNRWSITGWTNNNFGWAANADYECTAGPSYPLTYTDTVLADTYDIYYLKNTGLGTFNAQATGGTSVPVDTNAASAGIGVVTITAAAAATTNVVTITPGSTTSIHIIGCEPSLSTTKKIRVGNAGVGSSKSSDWIGVDLNMGGLNSIQAYAPDLTIISIGVNDAGASVATATYQANVQSMITAAQASGDVLLMSPIPSQTAAGSAYLTYEPLYDTVLLGLGVPDVNLPSYADWVSGDHAASLGLMYDSLHPNASGYANIAAIVAAAIYR